MHKLQVLFRQAIYILCIYTIKFILTFIFRALKDKNINTTSEPDEKGEVPVQDLLKSILP